MKESLVLTQEAITQNDGTAIKTKGLEKLQDIMTEAKEKARSTPRPSRTHKIYSYFLPEGMTCSTTCRTVLQYVSAD